MEAMTFSALRSAPEGEAYPRHLLAECDTALILFAAAFLGRQDAYWIADAGVTGWCVDVDATKLDAMRELYPLNWIFQRADVYAATDLPHADLVSVDCPSGHFERNAGEYLEGWCNLARKYVVLGTGTDTELSIPDGWRLIEKRHRSDFAGGVYWAVLGRDA